MLLGLVAQRSTPTNAALAAAAPAEVDCRILPPRQALALEARQYTVVGRLAVPVHRRRPARRQAQRSTASTTGLQRSARCSHVASGRSTRRARCSAPPFACALAVEAAAAAGADLIGVDMLPDEAGGYVVIELNGAVEFTAEYTIDRDPFAATLYELVRVARGGGEELEKELVASDVSALGLLV